MSNFRTLDAVFGAGFFAALGLAVFSFSAKNIAQDFINNLNGKHGGVGPFQMGGGGGTNSPLVVRGGAMTFRANTVNAVSGMDSTYNNVPCLELDASYVELLDVTVDT